MIRPERVWAMVGDSGFDYPFQMLPPTEAELEDAERYGYSFVEYVPKSSEDEVNELIAENQRLGILVQDFRSLIYRLNNIVEIFEPSLQESVSDIKSRALIAQKLKGKKS